MASLFGTSVGPSPTRLDLESFAVPVSPAPVYGSDCLCIELDVTNPTVGQITLTVTDGDGKVWINFPIAANGSMMNYRSIVGRKMKNGMIWSASAPGLIGSGTLRKGIS